MRGMLRTIAGTAALGLAATACSGGDGDADPQRRERRLPDVALAAALTPVSSCDDLLAWIVPEARERVTAWGLGGTGPVYPLLEGDGAGFDAAESRAASAPVTTATAGGGAGDEQTFSGTNVQVEGVDEPDVVKTDGKRIVAIAGGKLHVVDVSDGEPRKLGSLELPGGYGYGSELLLSGDRALVLANAGWEVMPLGSVMVDRGIVPPNAPGATITEVELAADGPRVRDSVTIEGSYVSARMVGDVARIVVRTDPQVGIGFVQPTVPGKESEERAEAVNRQVIEDTTADDWLPAYVLSDAKGEARQEGRLVDCDALHRPAEFAGFGELVVMTVDVSEGLAAGVESRNATAVLAGGETVYASPEHLYVATTEYVDWEALSDAERARVDRDYGTEVHRFDISDPAATTYDVSGRVDGHLLNQFSMDEHDGNLRIATTKGSPWMEGEGESESQVVVLGERDDALQPLGTVGGLGRGETIHSVRFMGERGYVVTFEQTDPLYVLDLADPAAPKVKGELKILGYSAYLHPVADGYLLGVGQDATEAGQQLGTQVALFDVRDPANPQRIAQATLPGGGNSAVEWDHRAFLWWPKTTLAVVPVQQWDAASFNGAIGFGVDVDAAAIAERGRVTHPAAIDPSIRAEFESQGEPIPPDYVPYVQPITRSLVVGDTLWTLSEAGLLGSNVQTLAAGPWLPLA